jgi:hypothetical protein
MGSRQRVPRATRTQRFVHGRRLDRNPLRRGTDRVETVVLVLLVVAFLAGAPLAALVSGARAHAMAHRAELAQAASRRQVTAVVLVAPAASSAGPWNLTSVTKTGWTAPDGTVMTSELPVSVTAAAGSKFPVWTTRDGQVTSHPMDDSQVASLTLLGEAVGVAAVALLVVLTGAVARWSLNQRRMAAWDADWRATSPRWTTRT